MLEGTTHRHPRIHKPAEKHFTNMPILGSIPSLGKWWPPSWVVRAKTTIIGAQGLGQLVKKAIDLSTTSGESRLGSKMRGRACHPPYQPERPIPSISRPSCSTYSLSIASYLHSPWRTNKPHCSLFPDHWGNNGHDGQRINGPSLFFKDVRCSLSAEYIIIHW